MNGTVAEVAKHARSVLKRTFPKQKISVTSGYGNINVVWTDAGPNVEQVQEILVTAGCAEDVSARYFRNDNRRILEADGYKFYFDRYNAAERDAEAQRIQQAQEDSRAQWERQSEAVKEASAAKRAAVNAVPQQQPEPWIQDEALLHAFDALRQRAELEVHIDEDRERRPSWAPPLILGEELAETCLELGLLTLEDKLIGRLWATFASPKGSAKYLRQHVSRHTLEGIQCRGFQFFAGATRQSTSTLLFEAQVTDGVYASRWRFGPVFYAGSYSSPRWSEWQDLLRRREGLRIQQEKLPHQPDYYKSEIEELSQRIAAIDAEDLAGAQRLNTRETLRQRAMNLARARVLDFVGAPDVQMQLAARLCGHCAICFKALTDPISLERGIGPDCHQHRIDFIRLTAKQGWPPERIAFFSGMPVGFITEVLNEAQREKAS